MELEQFLRQHTWTDELPAQVQHTEGMRNMNRHKKRQQACVTLSRFYVIFHHF